MALWLFMALFACIAGWLALAPLLRGSEAENEKNSREELYRRQIDEIEADESNRVITADEAKALRIEAQRRLLSAASMTSENSTETPHAQKIAAAFVGVLVVLGGSALYGMLGSPTALSAAQDRAPIAVNDDPEAAQQNLERMADEIAARLETEPDSEEGWRLLGWAQFNLGRYSEAANSYARASMLAPDHPDYHSAIGEALVMASSGRVTDMALAAFDKATSLNPVEPRANFFKGLVLDQAGDTQGAIDKWISMIEAAEPGAEWVPSLRERVIARAQQAGIDISGRLAVVDDNNKSVPSAEQIAAVQSMSAEDQQAMIAGMVGSLAARLEENPNDLDGWLMLIRSQMTLGLADDAGASLQTALGVFADNPEAASMLREAASALGVVTPHSE